MSHEAKNKMKHNNQSRQHKAQVGVKNSNVTLTAKGVSDCDKTGESRHESTKEDKTLSNLSSGEQRSEIDKSLQFERSGSKVADNQLSAEIIFEYKYFPELVYVREHIRNCEGRHKQQVAYSTFHDALTQICFICKKIRSNIKI